jgi:PRTRC genetic system protein B
MNSKTAELQGKFSPVQAIIVYKNESEYYLESHSINDKGEMMEGQPLSESTIKKIAKVYGTKIKKAERAIPYHKGLLPRNVFMFDCSNESRNLIWAREPEKKVIHFKKQLNIPSGDFITPALLYAVSGSSLYVFAMKDCELKNGIVDTTKLYQAPFHNVASNGGVCLGNGKIKFPTDPSLENIISYYENFFWLTEFSHLGTGANPTVSNLTLVMKQHVDSNKPFDENELKPSNFKTFNHLFNGKSSLYK